MNSNLIQAFIRTISTTPALQAPAKSAYPTQGQVSTGDLPLALTFMVSASLDATGTIRTEIYEITVMVEQVGQDTWASAKARALTLLELFVTKFRVSNASSYLAATTPTFRIVPGTVEFSGVERPVVAPDGGQYHGFTVTVTATSYLDGSCS